MRRGSGEAGVIGKAVQYIDKEEDAEVAGRRQILGTGAAKRERRHGRRKGK